MTPKLHILEDHVVPFLEKWGVGLGFWGEHGAHVHTVNILKKKCTILIDHNFGQKKVHYLVFGLSCSMKMEVYLEAVAGPLKNQASGLWSFLKRRHPLVFMAT